MLSSTARRKEMILFGQRRSVLPSRGVLGGALLLLLLVIYFVVFDGFRAHPQGMSVMLSAPRQHQRPHAIVRFARIKTVSSATTWTANLFRGKH